MQHRDLITVSNHRWGAAPPAFDRNVPPPIGISGPTLDEAPNTSRTILAPILLWRDQGDAAETEREGLIHGTAWPMILPGKRFRGGRC
jgi:hypothetical protein